MKKLVTTLWDIHIGNSQEISKAYKIYAKKECSNAPMVYGFYDHNRKEQIFLNSDKIQDITKFLAEYILGNELVNADDLKSENDCLKRAHKLVNTFFNEVLPNVKK